MNREEPERQDAEGFIHELDTMDPVRLSLRQLVDRCVSLETYVAKIEVANNMGRTKLEELDPENEAMVEHSRRALKKVYAEIDRRDCKGYHS